MSAATLIVTAFVEPAATLDAELAQTARAPARMTAAAVVALRVDFIVPPFPEHQVVSLVRVHVTYPMLFAWLSQTVVS
jgi:hypothetical protein